jgi:Tfp pilus assembly protein PilO
VNPKLIPWLRVWWAWIPPVILLLVCIAMLVWQSSGTLGRRGAIENQRTNLTERLNQLEAMVDGAADERRRVAATTENLDRIFDEVFGRYELRLTRVLREIDQAVRTTGMIPEGYNYTIGEVEGAAGSRFSIRFKIEGTYAQVVQMLDTIQSSPQFLVVEQVTFRGEDDAVTKVLAITLSVSTVFSDAEPGQLAELASRLSLGEAEEVSR